MGGIDAGAVAIGAMGDPEGQRVGFAILAPLPAGNLHRTAEIIEKRSAPVFELGFAHARPAETFRLAQRLGKDRRAAEIVKLGHGDIARRGCRGQHERDRGNRHGRCYRAGQLQRRDHEGSHPVSLSPELGVFPGSGKGARWTKPRGWGDTTFRRILHRSDTQDDCLWNERAPSAAFYPAGRRCRQTDEGAPEGMPCLCGRPLIRPFGPPSPRGEKGSSDAELVAHAVPPGAEHG